MGRASLNIHPVKYKKKKGGGDAAIVASINASPFETLQTHPTHPHCCGIWGFVSDSNNNTLPQRPIGGAEGLRQERWGGGLCGKQAVPPNPNNPCCGQQTND